MTLEEAIKYGEVILVAPETAAYQEPPKAIRLLIEAGKREQIRRIGYKSHMVELLPGETKD